MSPLVRKKRERYHLPTTYVLLILTLLCVLFMVLSFTTNILSGPLNAMGSTLIPFQKGLTNVGTAIVDRTENFKTLQTVMAENEELKLSMGLTDNTHDLTIALEKASTALQYTVAVRDKLLEAYKELMQIQI